MTIQPTTLLDAARAVQNGTATPTSLVEQALANAQTRADLNAIAALNENAPREAEDMTREAQEGAWRGPLHGIPITIKDLFNVRGLPTKCGAKASMPTLLPDEAEAVQRLRGAGAIVLAKTNMVEIALGTTGENPWTGDVKNPHDPARMSGGSSSGSAAAVAAGIGLGSLGTDTAGSIRIPAAWCGVVGFKPTYGRVPLAGALDLCWSCDHAGPITKTVADARLMFEVLADAPAQTAQVRGPRLGVPRAYLAGALSAGVRAAFEDFLRRAKAAGATLVEIQPEYIEHGVAAFVPLRAESSFTHRRAIETEPENFSPFVRAELERGLRVTAQDYLQGLQLQKLVRDGMRDCLKNVDAIVMPAVPCVAPLRGATETELESGVAPLRGAVLHLSRPFALAGLPTVSLPFAQVDGLPVGLQIACDLNADHAALNIAEWAETV
ncbi:MAG TPA: amidase [Thermoflexales bacterium]|nr:amidase [Thermoflexales bacterium]HQW34215.1 amidase [Thermoflexales bacterium]